MARGVYLVSGANQTVVGGPTLVFINPGTTATLEILRCFCSQHANATSNQQRIEMGTQVTAFPTVVGATPRPLALIDQASKIISGVGGVGTSGINASAENGGAKTPIYSDAFNVLNGWQWVATPQDSIIISAGGAAGFYLAMIGTPVTLTGWNFGVEYKEW